MAESVETLIGLAVVAAIVILVTWLVLYRWHGAPAQGDAVEASPGSSDFLVRTYRGHDQADAVGAYVGDAEALAARGYEPVGHSWGEGQWDFALVLAALLLSIFGVGLVLLAYMAISRPDGTLLVTYRLREGRP